MADTGDPPHEAFHFWENMHVLESGGVLKTNDFLIRTVKSQQTNTIVPEHSTLQPFLAPLLKTWRPPFVPG